MFDLIVKNGKIVDGTGKPAYTEDIAIQKGKIAAIGHDLGPGQHTIDATELVVSPGFIDIHAMVSPRLRVIMRLYNHQPGYSFFLESKFLYICDQDHLVILLLVNC